VFSGIATDYRISIEGDTVIVTDTVVGRDGVDRLTGIERLQFADRARAGVGLPSPALRATWRSSTTPAARGRCPVAGQLLRVSNRGVHDADNVGAGNASGAVTGPVAYYWQVETIPAPASMKTSPLSPPVKCRGRLAAPTGWRTMWRG
jgi:hypothetical protein